MLADPSVTSVEFDKTTSPPHLTVRIRRDRPVHVISARGDIWISALAGAVGQFRDGT